MDLIYEIRKAFAEVVYNRVIRIDCLGDKYPAWAIRHEQWYGIAVPIESYHCLNESFSSVKLRTGRYKIGGEEYDLLLLTSETYALRYEFAAICAQMVDLGEDGFYRKMLISDPLNWWNTWKKMLGNAISEKPVYGILGELLVLEYLIKKGYNPEWTGPESGTHDIEFEKEGYEIKSTTNKYDTIVTVSSQFQLQQDKYEKLSLVFCRFEPSVNGDSIDSAVNRLRNLGQDIYMLNDKLRRTGFEEGCHSRKEKFRILEKRKYSIDKDFPAISPESFKSGRIPEEIIQITYKLDLSGLKYEALREN